MKRNCVYLQQNDVLFVNNYINTYKKRCEYFRENHFVNAYCECLL